MKIPAKTRELSLSQSSIRVEPIYELGVLKYRSRPRSIRLLERTIVEHDKIGCFNFVCPDFAFVKGC